MLRNCYVQAYCLRITKARTPGKGAKMYGCDALWGQVKGAQMREAIERIIGEPCACARGERCPLLGDGKQAERCEPVLVELLPSRSIDHVA